MKLLPRPSRAFTLLEVLIALGIFVMAIFSILELVSQNLRAVRRIKPYSVDATSLLAELMLTNRVEEGFTSGDFGTDYPGYWWSRDIYLVSSNGLFEVDFVVEREGEQNKMSVLLYRPQTTTRSGAGRGLRSRSAGPL